MSSKTANLAYKPMGLVGGLFAGVIATKVVNKLWSLATHDPDGPPPARTPQERWQKVAAGAALQGAVFAGVRTIVDRAGARQFEKWAGEYPEA